MALLHAIVADRYDIGCYCGLVGSSFLLGPVDPLELDIEQQGLVNQINTGGGGGGGGGGGCSGGGGGGGLVSNFTL